jgi:hypothetical protein
LQEETSGYNWERKISENGGVGFAGFDSLKIFRNPKQFIYKFIILN